MPPILRNSDLPSLIFSHYPVYLFCSDAIEDAIDMQEQQ